MNEKWPVRSLEEVCDFQRGLTYKKSDEVEEPGQVVLRANNVDRDSGVLVWDELRFISTAVQIPADKFVRAGCILVCTASGSKSHLGKVAFVDRDYGYAFGGFMALLVPKPGVSGRYLFHSLKSPAYLDFIARLSDGANINNLKWSDLCQFSMPVPPLAEQERIVHILDEALDAIDTAQANSKSQLKHATELHSAFMRMLLTQESDEWPSRRLGDLCMIRTGRKDVNQGNPSGLYPFFTCAAQHTYSDEYSFDCEAILVAGNGVVGQATYYKGKFEAYQRTYVLTDFAGISGRYLYRLLEGRLAKELSGRRLGNTMPYIKVGMLKDFLVLVPDASAQIALTEVLDRFAAEIEALTLVSGEKIAKLDELKRLTLTRALSGDF